MAVTNRRVLRGLRDVLTERMRQNDATAYATADEMAKSWIEYQNDPTRIGKAMSMTTFFTQGYWLNRESWSVLLASSTRSVH
jgi:hypothetical protein